MVVESMDMEIQLCLIQRNDYTLEYCGHGISALELRRGEQQGPIGSIMTPLAILSATVFFDSACSFPQDGKLELLVCSFSELTSFRNIALASSIGSTPGLTDYVNSPALNWLCIVINASLTTHYKLHPRPLPTSVVCIEP